MSYLIDTNIAIDLRDGDALVVDLFEKLESRPFLSVVTRVELEGGVYKAPALADKRRRSLDVLFEILPILDFDFEMGEVYGQIVAERGFSRRKIIDRMIAATALVHDLKLITRNGADFADVSGLKLEVWDRVR